MTRRGAVLLVVVGAIGLMTLVVIATWGAGAGPFGAGRGLSVVNCAPRDPRGAVVRVNLTDRGGAMMGDANPMMLSVSASPDSVTSGTVTFVATNTGVMIHELLVLPAAVDGVGMRAVSGDGTINEASSLGEASTSCGAGVGGGIAPGTTSWVTLHLAAGNYELLCDEPWHYANGMFTGFRVD